MKTNSTTAFLILAAGSSSRLGTPKQLLPWGDTNLLGHAIQQGIKAGIKDVFVVTGAFHEKIVKSIGSSEAHIIFNEDWSKGMGSSIAKGVAEICKTENNYSQILISVCDQPLIDAIFLKKLMTCISPEKYTAAATSYKGKPGVPALFHSSVFTSLRKLDGSTGAKALLKSLKNKVRIIKAANMKADIDTLEAYHHLHAVVFKGK